MGCDLRQGLDLQTCQATRESVQGNINKSCQCSGHSPRTNRFWNKNICKSIHKEVGAPQEVVTQVIVQDVGAEEDSEKVHI